VRDEDDFDYYDLDACHLVREWARQASRYRKARIELADARRDYEKAKVDRKLKTAEARRDYEKSQESCEQVVAEIDRDVRRNPTKYGVEKITEGSVEKTVLLQRDYRRAQDAVIDARYEMNACAAKDEPIDERHAMDVCEADVKALEQRKDALQDRVKLEINGLYAAPKEPDDPEVAEKVKAVERKMAFGGKKAR
jgi:hypothetical protein